MSGAPMAFAPPPYPGPPATTQSLPVLQSSPCCCSSSSHLFLSLALALALLPASDLFLSNSLLLLHLFPNPSNLVTTPRVYKTCNTQQPIGQMSIVSLPTRSSIRRSSSPTAPAVVPLDDDKWARLSSVKRKQLLCLWNSIRLIEEQIAMKEGEGAAELPSVGYIEETKMRRRSVKLYCNKENM
uniref:Uncharacterized protein n=1 Tax=Guillardia theta TaxID=55529 RepID=A0A7S4UE77_GUITH